MGASGMSPTITTKELTDPLVVDWSTLNPRDWWAFKELHRYPNGTSLQLRVLTAITSKDEKDESFLELTRFADALENFNTAQKKLQVQSPPLLEERRSFTASVIRMTPFQKDRTLRFCVDFKTENGWSGFFYTANAHLVETVSKLRPISKPISLVGEVKRPLFDFLLEFKSDVRIV